MRGKSLVKEDLMPADCEWLGGGRWCIQPVDQANANVAKSAVGTEKEVHLFSTKIGGPWSQSAISPAVKIAGTPDRGGRRDGSFPPPGGNLRPGPTCSQCQLQSVSVRYSSAW